jgi:hypothetical protein
MSSFYLLRVNFLLRLFFDPDDGGYIFLRKCLLTFNALHGVISQKQSLRQYGLPAEDQGDTADETENNRYTLSSTGSAQLTPGTARK